MQENLRLIPVFIGSPGGLDKEREAAREVVKEINEQNENNWGSTFRLTGWEAAQPSYKRPQDQINEALDQCRYFFGVIYDKWGSRTSNDASGYTSGFEEEYHRSAERIEAGHMKDMAIFFKSIPKPSGFEAGQEIKKVLDFREQFIENKNIFFKEFDDIESFKSAVRSKLMAIGWEEFNNLESKKENEADDKPPLTKLGSEMPSTNASSLFDEEASRFLSGMLAKQAEFNATTPGEVARLRLIAALVSRSGNDEAHLGTHDANLVFRYYRNSDLSDQECNALLRFGVAGFEDENTPLWHWLAKTDMGNNYLFRLGVLTTAGTVSEQVGAIRVLQVFGSRLHANLGPFNKMNALRKLLSAETETSVLEAFVSFLGTNGSEEDIELIEANSCELPLYQKSKVEAAIVEIIARRSVEDALRRICDLQLSNIENKLANKLLASPQSLSTEILNLCLLSKSDEIRLGAAKSLYDRQEIDVGKAKDLLKDDSVELRLVAAETLYRAGEELEGDELEKTLKDHSFMGLGLLSMSVRAEETQLELYRANRRSEQSPLELVERAESDIMEYKCLETLFQVHPEWGASRLREGLRDCFFGYFQVFREKSASDRDALEHLGKVVPLYKTALCNAAIKALCDLRKSNDLALVRHSLDSMDIDIDASIIKFFERFGEWQDINRVLKLSKKKEASGNALSIRSLTFAEERAAALLSLGKNRIVDLLGLELDTRVRTHLLKQIPNSTLAKLNDDVILGELAHENTECRAIVALRCVEALSKSRVEALLENCFDSAEYVYYNSIHWLDLGASLPKKLSRKIASRELANR